jgi:heme oxygenase
MAMSAVSLLRSRTAAAHEVVDAAFGGYDLRDPTDYRRFLMAHARALPVAEARAAAVWPELRRRTPLLAADLAALGVASDLASVTEADAGAGQFGALYVVEGSRLGGGLLAERVADEMPRAYLSATHEPGEWRAIRAAIDAAASGRDAAWHQALVAGALETFDLYAAAAAAEVHPV